MLNNSYTLPRMLWLLLLVASVNGFELVILHTNDIHARFEQFNKYGSSCSSTDAAAGNCFGGYARQATVIKRIRAQEPHVILLSGGDWSQGTVWYYVYEGLAAVRMMNELNYTAAGIGNHEYDKGVDIFINKFLVHAKFASLSANTDASKVPAMQGKFQKSTELTLGGRAIGIIGYTTSEMPDLSLSYGDLVFTGEVMAIQKEATRLKQKGVDIIIAVGHSGLKTDSAIARAVPEVDVVVGGHDNVFMYNGEAPSSPERVETPYPYVVQQNSGKAVPVLCVQDYMFGKYLGFLKVQFDNQGEVQNYSGNPILLDNSYPEDPDVQRSLLELKDNVTQIQNISVGTSFVSLPNVWIRPDGETTSCRIEECALGNLFADSMVYKNLEQPESLHWARVSMAAWNSGGIRGGLNVDMQGSITNGDIITVAPFGNQVVILTLRGVDIRRMLEHSVARYEEEKGQFLQLAGIRVLYDITRPVGSRVVSVNVRCSNCSNPHYTPLDEQKIYPILVNSYIAGGGDGFAVLRDNRLSFNPIGFVDSDMLREFISERTPILHEAEGRIRFASDCTSSVVSSAYNTAYSVLVVCMCFVVSRYGLILLS